MTEAERVYEKIQYAPDGNHDEKSDESPHDELLTFLSLFFVRSSEYEVSVDSPKKHYERYREDKRDEVVVEERDETLEKVAELSKRSGAGTRSTARLCLSECKSRHEECGKCGK